MMQETAHTGPWVVGYMYLRYFNEMEDVSGIVATYPPGRFSCRGCPLSWTLKNAETLAGEGSHSKEDSGPRTPPVHLPYTSPVRILYASRTHPLIAKIESNAVDLFSFFFFPFRSRAWPLRALPVIPKVMAETLNRANAAAPCVMRRTIHVPTAPRRSNDVFELLVTAAFGRGT